MTNTISIINSNIFQANSVKKNQHIFLTDKIQYIGALHNNNLKKSEIIIDAQNLIVLPGFIELHTFGAFHIGTDSSNEDELRKLCKKLPEFGVTSFLASIGAAPFSKIDRSLQAISNCMANRELQGDTGADLLGCYCEGLCTHPMYRGSQANIKNICTYDAFEKLLNKYPTLFKIVTIAPDNPSSTNFETLSKRHNFKKAIGHTKANYKDSNNHFQNGYNYVTHLFNAMPWFDKKDPGLIGAALLNDNVYVEIIPDLIHVMPEYLRMALKMKPTDKIIFVTDSMKFAGTNFVGQSTFLGLPVKIDLNGAYLENGKLAASILTFNKILKNIKSIDPIPLEKLIATITSNPATVLGFDDSKGYLRENYDADIVLTNKNFDILCTITKGEIAYNKLKSEIKK